MEDKASMSFFSLLDILLEGGKRLEEFGQVDVRVAAGCQSFVGHLLQPAVRLLFSFPALRAIWKRRERSPELATLKTFFAACCILFWQTNQMNVYP